MAPIFWMSSFRLEVVYLDSFLGPGCCAAPSVGTPMGGSGGGIPRLLEMIIASAIAILETAWITVAGGGRFLLLSSIIWLTSARSPDIWALPLMLSCAIDGM